MLNQFKKHLWLIIAVPLLLIAGGMFISMKQEPSMIPVWEENHSDQLQQEQIQSSIITETESIVVDIKGAITKPGIYQLSSQARLYELVEIAGGLTEEGQERVLNLAEKLTDQQMVYIPHKHEVTEEQLQQYTNNSHKNVTESSGKVNLNTAALQDLQQLNGIGAKKAQMIIDYREEKGNFQTIDDLKNVSGIGEKTVDNLRDSITI